MADQPHPLLKLHVKPSFLFTDSTSHSTASAAVANDANSFFFKMQYSKLIVKSEIKK